MQNQAKQKKKEGIKEKFRVVIVNENTLEEKFSVQLSLYHTLVIGGFFAISLIVLTSLVIIYTPLRQYVLGFSEVEFNQRIVTLNFKADSLETALKNDKRFIEAIQKVIRGDLPLQEFNKDSIVIDNVRNNMANLDIEPTEEELKLRQEVAEEERYSVFDKATSHRKEIIFFSPISGVTTAVFSPEEKHFGVDVSTKEGTPVKAIADGVVIFSEWSLQAGFVVILKHAENFVSVYKNNAMLTKKQGDLVKAGEVIGSVGNLIEISKGAHLHFELWNNGYPIDPFTYINFK